MGLFPRNETFFERFEELTNKIVEDVALFNKIVEPTELLSEKK